MGILEKEKNNQNWEIVQSEYVSVNSTEHMLWSIYNGFEMLKKRKRPTSIEIYKEHVVVQQRLF